MSSKSFMVPGAGYGYTGTPVDQLTSTENTIVTMLLDESGSTTSYARQMELCVKEVVKSLRHCPQKDRLIYRHCHFDTNFREVHGFKPLIDCKEDDYDGVWAGGGSTALYNSCENVVLSTLDYAKQQAEQRYLVNGIIFIITDGQNYLPGQRSKTQDDVKAALANAIASESLESLMTILIGINSDPSVQKDLQNFANNVGFTQYVEIEKADEKTLARLQNFSSQLVQSQSQALGSGGPSQSLTF